MLPAAAGLAQSAAPVLGEDAIVTRTPPPPIESELRDDLLFVAADSPAIIHSPLRHRSKRRKWLSLLIVLCLVTSGGFAVYWFRHSLRQTAHDLADLTTEGSRNQAKDVAGPPPAEAAFPRRALAICVNNYLYANPVSYGDPDNNLHRLLERLIRAWHIPASQVIELSDAVPTAQPERSSSKPSRKKSEPVKPRPALVSSATPPLKPVIEKTIARFLESSRPQDRILLFFLGHAVVIDDQPYLAPLEGDLTDKKTLIPLAWLYERLAQCPARQKILILDCSRLDPARGMERPTGGAMEPKLDEALRTPPAGVQVWSACTAGQYSYEIDGASVFLQRLYRSLTQTALKKIQQPEDALPILALAESVNKATTAEVESSLKTKQTPRLAGQESLDGAPYDGNEPGPEKIDIAIASPPGGMAGVSEIRSILKEIELPPIKLSRQETASLHIESLIPFSSKMMEPYRADYSSLDEIEKAPARFPLRSAILQVIKLVNEEFNPEHAAISFRESFSAGGNADKMKEEILKEQAKPAKVLLKLNEALEVLRRAGEKRDAEPSKRWQAHYDYILAQLLARIAYLHEYDLMLGKIRKDELPELTPNVHMGYRLSSQEKLQSGREVRELAAQSRKILTKLAKEHAGTPWETLARRARLDALGLKWEPVR
jgi:hypothetical protein